MLHSCKAVDKVESGISKRNVFSGSLNIADAIHLAVSADFIDNIKAANMGGSRLSKQATVSARIATYNKNS